MKMNTVQLGCEPRSLKFARKEAEIQKVLGSGFSATVYLAIWEGEKYITKVFKVSSKSLIQNPVANGCLFCSFLLPPFLGQKLS